MRMLNKEVKTMDLNDEIRKLAYQQYEKSGKVACRDLDNWLEAERMILEQQGREKNPEATLSPPLKMKRTSTGKKASEK
jgi:hypothetical protein